MYSFYFIFIARVCIYRCEDEFGLLNRKHHCRKCGGVFCDGCTSHKVSLDQHSTETVRVCKSCYYAIISNSKFITTLPTPTPVIAPLSEEEEVEKEEGAHERTHTRVDPEDGDSDDEDDVKDEEDEVRPSMAADDTPCVIC